MRDEFPGVAFLTPAQVRKLLGFTNPREFDAFVAEHRDFPGLVVWGKTARGKARLRYPKGKVLAFCELHGG